MIVSQYSIDKKSKMTRLNLIIVFVLMVCLAITEAGSRVPRSPQFGKASASAKAFGGNKSPSTPGFGGPGSGKPGGNSGKPGSSFGPSGNFGRPGGGFGPSRPGTPQGLNINIAKSVSIGSGRGSASSSAAASSRG